MVEHTFGLIKEWFAGLQEFIFGPKPADIYLLTKEFLSLTSSGWVDRKTGRQYAPESMDDPSLRPGFKRKYPPKYPADTEQEMFFSLFSPDESIPVTVTEKGLGGTLGPLIAKYKITPQEVYMTDKDGSRERSFTVGELKALKRRLLVISEKLLCNVLTLKIHNRKYPQFSKYFPDLLAARGSWFTKHV